MDIKFCVSRNIKKYQERRLIFKKIENKSKPHTI